MWGLAIGWLPNSSSGVRVGNSTGSMEEVKGASKLNDSVSYVRSTSYSHQQLCWGMLAKEAMICRFLALSAWSHAAVPHCWFCVESSSNLANIKCSEASTALQHPGVSINGRLPSQGERTGQAVGIWRRRSRSHLLLWTRASSPSSRRRGPKGDPSGEIY